MTHSKIFVQKTLRYNNQKAIQMGLLSGHSKLEVTLHKNDIPENNFGI
jgi:hypothetical protein